MGLIIVITRIVFLAGCATLWTSAANAGPAGSSGVSISASVPLVCEIQAADFHVDPEQNTAQGFVDEMCNGSNGFRVIASYRTLAGDEDVQLVYGGESSQLSASGSTELAFQPGPSLRTVPVSIVAEGLDGGLAITLGLTAL